MSLENDDENIIINEDSIIDEDTIVDEDIIKIIPILEFGYQRPLTKEDENLVVEISKEDFDELNNGRRKWVEENGSYSLIPYDDSEDIEKYKASFEILELKKYLSDTDYVIIKIQEALIDNDEELANQLKVEYSDIITQRKQYRARINELESLQTRD